MVCPVVSSNENIDSLDSALSRYQNPSFFLFLDDKDSPLLDEEVDDEEESVQIVISES